MKIYGANIFAFIFIGLLPPLGDIARAAGCDDRLRPSTASQKSESHTAESQTDDSNTMTGGNSSDSTDIEQFQALTSLLETSKRISERQADTFKKSIGERLTSFRETILNKNFDTDKSTAMIGRFNSIILKAAFLTFKPAGLRRFNPRIKRVSVLPAHKAVQLLIVNEGGSSWATLGHDLGLNGQMQDMAYYSEVVPKICNSNQFEAVLLGLRANFKSIYYYQHVALGVTDIHQLEAIRLGFRAHYISPFYYQNIARRITTDLQLNALEEGIKADLGLQYFQDVALQIKTVEQLHAIKRGVQAGFKDLGYYRRVVR